VNVGGVIESVLPRLFSDKNEHTRVPLAVLQTISVHHLAHTDTQEQSEESTQICPANPQSLYCSSGRRFEEEMHCVSLQFSYYSAIISLSIDQFRRSPGRSSSCSSRGTESLSWHSRLALNLQFSHMRPKMENSSQCSSFWLIFHLCTLKTIASHRNTRWINTLWVKNRPGFYPANWVVYFLIL